MITKHSLCAAVLATALLALATQAQSRSGTPEIELSATQLSRLGVEWARPTTSNEVALAAGMARAVVPPAQEAVVSTQVAGLVTRLLAAEGTTVAAGEPLLELTSSELLELERDYLEAAAAAGLAAAQLERDRGLFADGIVAERRLNETVAAADSAAIRREQASQQLALAGLDSAAIDALARSRQLTPVLTLKAPIDGTIISHHLSLGEQVEPYTPAARVADLSRLWLELRLPQERADVVGPGMSLRVDVAGKTLSARIFQIGRTVDPATQTVLIRAEIDNGEGRLRSDQVLPGRVVDDASNRGSLTLPSDSIIRLDGAPHVFSRTARGVALVPVEILGSDDRWVYIRAGALDATAEVAISGISTLKSMLVSDETGAG
jgi:cobalt-zinc-cadmium efflux system membrane fusion protein